MTTSYNRDWFTNCTTTAEIKSRYRSLAKEWHPDLGGDTKTMQDINAAYHNVLQRMSGTVEYGSDNKDHTYYYNAVQEQEIMDKLAELLRSKLPGCEIWLIGKWLWVEGETKPVKGTLKAAGMMWHSKRLAWYW